VVFIENFRRRIYIGNVLGSGIPRQRKAYIEIRAQQSRLLRIGGRFGKALDLLRKTRAGVVGDIVNSGELFAVSGALLAVRLIIVVLAKLFFQHAYLLTNIIIALTLIYRLMHLSVHLSFQTYNISLRSEHLGKLHQLFAA